MIKNVIFKTRNFGPKKGIIREFITAYSFEINDTIEYINGFI